MKIDISSHILPIKYKEALYAVVPGGFPIKRVLDSQPTLWDLELRARITHKYQDLVQVLTLSAPPVERIADSKKAVELSKMANDEMAELVYKYPDRFCAAIACVPMNNIEAALEEVDRAVNDLKFRGIQLFTPVNDKPLDLPEFTPLFEKMSRYNLPILIHPTRDADYPDYRTEEKSILRIARVT